MAKDSVQHKGDATWAWLCSLHGGQKVAREGGTVLPLSRDLGGVWLGQGSTVCGPRARGRYYKPLCQLAELMVRPAQGHTHTELRDQASPRSPSCLVAKGPLTPGGPPRAFCVPTCAVTPTPTHQSSPSPGGPRDGLRNSIHLCPTEVSPATLRPELQALPVGESGLNQLPSS